MKLQIPVLSLTGPVGIGKSTTAESVSHFLRAVGLKHAIIDLDYVRRVYPTSKSDPLNTTLAFRNFAALWNNYFRDGARLLIVPSVIEKQQDLDGITSAVPGANLTVVRLEASLEVNHARIVHREVTDLAIDWNIKTATAMHTSLAKHAFEDFVIRTDQKTPEEIAREALSLWGVVTSHPQTVSL